MDDLPMFNTSDGKIIRARAYGFDTVEDARSFHAEQELYEESGVMRFMAQLKAAVVSSHGWSSEKRAAYAAWEHCATCGKFMAPFDSNEDHHVNEGYSPDPDTPPLFVHYCAEHCPVCNGLNEQGD